MVTIIIFLFFYKANICNSRTLHTTPSFTSIDFLFIFFVSLSHRSIFTFLSISCVLPFLPCFIFMFIFFFHFFLSFILFFLLICFQVQPYYPEPRARIREPVIRETDISVRQVSSDTDVRSSRRILSNPSEGINNINNNNFI